MNLSRAAGFVDISSLKRDGRAANSFASVSGFCTGPNSSRDGPLKLLVRTVLS